MAEDFEDFLPTPGDDELNPEQAAALSAALDNYAANVSGMTVEEIIQSEFDGPAKKEMSAAMKEAVKAWRDIMSGWASKYGDLGGYGEFINAVALSGLGNYPDWANGATGLEALTNPHFSNIRLYYANGGSGAFYPGTSGRGY